MSKKFDIVIIGAGTAGMACAIEAASRGGQVCLIEKDDQIGGAMHWSGGHMSAGGTRLQKRNDIDDSIDDHYNDIIRINGSSGDLKLIRKAVIEAPITLDWLDELNFPWAPECPRIIYGHVPYTKARTQYGVNKAISIYETILPEWNKYVASENITIHLSSTFIRMDDEMNNLKTVFYQTLSGEKSVTGHHIVYTAGGYGSNPEFFNEKHPGTPYNSSTYPMATAEIQMYLESKGAGFRMADLHLPSLGGIELEPGSGRSNFNEAWAMVLTSVYRQPRDIYVNSYGMRFLAEDEENADIREREVVKQDEWHFWVIFDEESLMERNPDGSENPIMIGWTSAQIKAEAVKNKAIFEASSIEELAQKTGLPYNNLAKTIDDFNNYVDNGQDPDFGRTYLENKVSKAPYYAIKVFASLLVTFGGITVNDSLEILDQEGIAMKNCYAAGEIIGLGATSGNAFCSGMAITPALSFGRILGRNLIP